MDFGKLLILMSTKISWNMRPLRPIDTGWHY